MPIPTATGPEGQEVLDRFFADAAAVERRVLMLDYDGTLAPFREKRDEAVPYEGLRPLLTELLSHTGTRLVIVTGRALEDVIPLLGIDPLPEIWGSHGWQRKMSDGSERFDAPSSPVMELLAAAMATAASLAPSDAIEPKPTSVAVHIRGSTPMQARRTLDTVGPLWRSLVERSGGGLALHDFDGGLELRATGRDKGHAVRTILGEEEPGLKAAYLGDDSTDEDAFEAIAGSGLPVLVRNEYRPTRAHIWLRPPHELFHFLNRWLDI